MIVAEKTTGHTDRNALMLHPDIMGVSTSFCEDGAVKTSPQRVRNLEVRMWKDVGRCGADCARWDPREPGTCRGTQAGHT